MVIPAELLDKVTDAAEKSYPDEACGLLVGTVKPGAVILVSSVEPAPNVASGSRNDRFEIDPRVRFALMRRLRGGGERLIGHYHSHPDHPTSPSRRDLEMAFEPDLIWLITSVTGGHVADTAAYIPDLVAGCFRPVALRAIAPGQIKRPETTQPKRH
ncbi:MAG: Mov34/MPN/PAD-1 family protein [Hyphomicrobium sp.]